MTQDQLFKMRVIGTDRDHPLARFSDPETSLQADAALRKREGKTNEIRHGTHRHRALSCFSDGAKIAEEVKFLTGVDGIWKRVSDLKNMGLIRPTGYTRMSSEGREAEILELTAAGWAALARLEER